MKKYSLKKLNIRGYVPVIAIMECKKTNNSKPLIRIRKKTFGIFKKSEE